MKKTYAHDASSDALQFAMPSDASIHEKLLNIYWYKKELEEFLPQIATYAKPHEIAVISISQLAIMEKQLLAILADLSNEENKKQ